jgi:glycosyltransferase involved in cell wall biosynthesis
MTNAESPLVSVIIPAFNASEYISETLDSVRNQTYGNLEIIVVDDGSADHTPEYVESICRKDDRVRLLRQANQGVAAARNTAIKYSAGQFIAPIDSDDIWYPRKIEKQVNCFQESGLDVGVVYTWSTSISPQGGLYGAAACARFEGDVFTTMIYQNFIGNASVPLIRRSCIDRVGGYNTQLRAQGAQGCEDWDLTLRLAEHYRYRVVPEFLMGYRQVENSMSSNSEAMARSYFLVIEEMRQRHPGIPEYVFRWSESQFCLYLMWKSYIGGDMRGTLKWIIRAFRTDLAAVLAPATTRFLLRGSLRILAEPITSAIWPSRQDWLDWKAKFIRKPKPKPQTKERTVSDLQQEVGSGGTWQNVYEFLLNRRQSRVAECWQRRFDTTPG